MRCELHRGRSLSRLAAGLLVLCAAGLPLPPARAAVGDMAALAGRTVRGTRFDLAQWRGKVIIINFWATWCTPCRAEMPMLSAFARAHGPQGVQLMGVSEDVDDAAAKVRKVMRSVTYPSAMLDGLTANSFGHPHLLPITYVVGRKGHVRAILRPGDAPLSAAHLWQVVAPLLR